jgi:cell division transport system ATP-binding protein
MPYMRRNIGVVFQDFKLLERRTVSENVSLPLEVMGKPRSFIRKKISQVLRFVQLEEKSKILCCRLSGGEQQRVAIARAVVNSPSILLADEPTGNLDERVSQDVMALFKHIHSQGTTVILATHDRLLPSLVPESRIVEIHRAKMLDQSCLL